MAMSEEKSPGEPRSKLLDILLASPAGQVSQLPTPDIGVAEVEPFPFLAIVGQYEMKLALTLVLINPQPVCIWLH
jgi:magnesium chelatase subunit I